ncbi:MAG: Nif3-like dinuclear metal center hexameric protein [Chitinophagales bacterium]|nr:Nif3-like dinuclear metal center hexameric protein [Chitinophagales bacterium]MDW8419482.1 Nif3-like dinuclear metal center hexameric protein [Chitinophagales bacterium]
MTIRDITDYLETLAPASLQESYDNCGLLTGSHDTKLKGILVTLDCTEEVVDEAIRHRCNLIVAHHPIIFKGLKRLTGASYTERAVIKAIKNDIAIYAIHTNLDNVRQGVNAEIAGRIGLQRCSVLLPKEGTLCKLYTFIPVKDFARVAAEVFKAGAGHIGNYSETSFRTLGTGTFRGNENTNPAIGQRGVLEEVEEVKFETIFPAYLQHKVVAALLRAHPYEEVAYDVVPLKNTHAGIGSGLIGDLPKPMEELLFLKKLKKQMQAACIRHTALRGKPVQRVAVCGGAGSFLLKTALTAGADVFITADFKYHEFFDAENRLIIADIGHYESEQFTRDRIAALISEKFPNIAPLISKINTNPVHYL